MSRVARKPLYSIVLAAGKGRRMRNQTVHKVCFTIGGVPAIQRALDVYNRAGVVRNVIVVGEMAGQVVETVGQQFRNAVFAFQPEARGTGDAARCGLQALSEVDPDARILIVAGDKIINSAALTRLVAAAERADSDLTVLVSPARWGGSSAGRVLFGNDDRPLAIAEMADLRVRAVRSDLLQRLNGGDPPAAEELEVVVQRRLGPQASLMQVLGDGFGDPANGTIDPAALRARLRDLPIDVTVGDHTIDPTTAIESPFRNESVYLVRKHAIDFGIATLNSNNAQGELYLTDAVSAIFTAAEAGVPRFRVTHVATEGPADVMSYNNPEELLRIEDFFHGQRRQSIDDLQSRLGPARLKSINDWLEFFPEDGAIPQQTLDAFREYYGESPGLHERKCLRFRQVLQSFQQHYGDDRPVLLVRSPGRINLMGRHVDWQGGRCNLMAVTQEVIMAVAPRPDDRIEARNLDPAAFPDVSLSLGRLVSQLNWDDWMSVVHSSGLVQHLRESAGNWSLYLEAALLRLQMAHRDLQLRGMDMVVTGTIPVAAGLSSSSALVVATAESALALHGLDLAPQQFVNFCGEGEWFVGTRGGSADHAAMKYGRKGTINHVGFHEFELIEQLAFPESHALVVCNSFVQAKKAGGAREAFNARVGSYLVGVQLVRQEFPQFAPLIEYVRDISCETLRIPPSQIYEILMAVPEEVTAAEVRARFREHPDAWAVLEPHFAGVADNVVYPVRGVLMFGITECARSRSAADCLRAGDMGRLGLLMRVSHDGERCFQTHPDGSVSEFRVDISDAAMSRLIHDLASEDPARTARAQLFHQPGAYRCSTREIDTLADLALGVEGVEGAQIAGAGLGGCAMILVRNDAVEELESRLNHQYYEPRGLPSGAIRCTPSAGSGLVSIRC